MSTEPGPILKHSEPTAHPAGPAQLDPATLESATRVAVPLTSLRPGDRGRLHAARLVVEDREILYALGLAERSSFRVCKTGDPWIVKVRGTRIGLSPALAHHLLVIPGERTER